MSASEDIQKRLVERRQALRQQPPVKWINFIDNTDGLGNSPQVRKHLVNMNRSKDMEQLKIELAGSIGRGPVRNVYTPAGGTVVTNVADLEPGKAYVVGGAKFKPVSNLDQMTRKTSVGAGRKLSNGNSSGDLAEAPAAAAKPKRRKNVHRVSLLKRQEMAAKKRSDAAEAAAEAENGDANDDAENKSSPAPAVKKRRPARFVKSRPSVAATAPKARRPLHPINTVNAKTAATKQSNELRKKQMMRKKKRFGKKAAAGAAAGAAVIGGASVAAAMAKSDNDDVEDDAPKPDDDDEAKEVEDEDLEAKREDEAEEVEENVEEGRQSLNQSMRSNASKKSLGQSMRSNASKKSGYLSHSMRSSMSKKSLSPSKRSSRSGMSHKSSRSSKSKSAEEIIDDNEDEDDDNDSDGESEGHKNGSARSHAITVKSAGMGAPNYAANYRRTESEFSFNSQGSAGSNRSRSTVEVDYDHDESGAYKARGDRHRRGHHHASVVLDSSQTRVNRPVDLMEAREVDDYEDEAEAVTRQMKFFKLH